MSSSIHLKYRADVDGLRAVAILSVVFFHFSPELLPGGFTGVDIFFIISGYLISGILMRQLQMGTFRFRDFYTRRIKRLFPAMLVTMCACLAFGAYALFSFEFQDFGSQIMAATVFASNFKLYFESGYFDKTAEMKPLLHLWSLGLEEQFYILWPLLLFLTHKSRKASAVVISIGLVTLFGLTLILIEKNPTMAFYFPNRFWELMVGALLARLELFRPPPRATAFAQARSSLGLGMLIFSLLSLTGTVQFPGWPAILPSVGAALLISAGPEAFFNRCLANRLFIAIGLISYPLYLWHWPLLYFAKIGSAGDDHAAPRLVAVALSFLLAWLTYEFVEKSLRNRIRFRHLVPILLTAHLGLGGLGYLASTYGNGHPHNGQLDLGAKEDQLAEEKCGLPEAEAGLATWCKQDKRGKPNFAVIGDSHGDALYAGLLEETQGMNLRGLLIGKSSCSPLAETLRTKGPELGVSGEEAATCRDLTDATLQLMGQMPLVKTVILISATRMLNLENDYQGTTKGDPIVEGFAKTISSLEESGKKVIFVIDNPEITDSPELCLIRPFQFVNPAQSRNCFISRADFERKRAYYMAVVQQLKVRFPKLVVVDPTEILCDDQHCPVIKNGRALYSYTDHFSDFGSQQVAPEVIRNLVR